MLEIKESVIVARTITFTRESFIRYLRVRLDRYGVPRMAVK